MNKISLLLLLVAFILNIANLITSIIREQSDLHYKISIVIWSGLALLWCIQYHAKKNNNEKQL